MARKRYGSTGPLAEVVREAEAAGCSLQPGKKGQHTKLVAPNGKTYTMPTTPGQANRGLQNTVSGVRRWLRLEVLK